MRQSHNWNPGSALLKYCKYTCTCTKGVQYYLEQECTYKRYIAIKQEARVRNSQIKRRGIVLKTT